MELIQHPIKPEKEKAWHLYMHPYFTKQASNVVSSYIKNFTNEGDTVLDPFSGTGVTAIEALALKRKVIAVDLNPLACFITEQTVAQVNTELLLKEFIKLRTKYKEQIEHFDNASIEEIENTKIKHWYPKGIRLPKNTDKGFEFVEQLWTKRQLLGLSTLWFAIKKIKDEVIREQMKYIFSAAITRVNVTFHDSYKEMPDKSIKKINGGSVSILTHYRYWMPDRLVEMPVWKTFENRFKLIKKGKEKWNEITKDFNVKDNVKVICDSVSNLEKYISKNSVDYIYTDPPYGGNIAYLDLSTMWNAWLGFQVDDDRKKQEIIEGGDLEKTQKNYEELFAHSFEAMSRVLKKDGWLSLVFAHKKLEFWNLIIDANEDNGMEFKGSVYQPTNNSSIHYKKNPANVLCSQRIANFKKTFEKSVKEKPDDLKLYILNELERACLDNRGAAIDVIYQRVLDKLLNNNTIHEAKRRGYIKLEKLLLENDDLFYYDNETKLYYVKASEQTYDNIQKEYFQKRGELTTFVKSLLRAEGPMTLDDIHRNLFEIYSDDKKFPIDRLHQDLNVILEEIAYKSNHKHTWKLKENQGTFEFNDVIDNKLVKITSANATHSETIFRLVQIGKYLKYNSWIGKREQTVDSFEGIKFKDLSLTELPIKDISPSALNKISQIDVIWFDKFGNPQFAFEVEESTNVMTGFERFKNLLDFEHNVSNKLFIVAPKSRKRKISDVFKNSTYIGAPLYLENKIKLIYKEDLYNFYDEHLDLDFNENDIIKLKEDIV